MAVITKTNMTKLATLIGDSYQSILNAYGDYDTNDTAVNLIGKAKVFVRGGAETLNGIRQTETGSEGVALDLIPTTATDVVTVRRGEFYLNGQRQILQSNRTFDFGTLLPAKWWYGAGYDHDDDATLQPLAKHAQRTRALIYTSNEAINTTTHPGATDMVSGDNFQTTHADFRLDGTTDLLAAGFAAPTANVNLDKVQLYLSTNTSGAAPNTGLKLYIAANAAGSAPDDPDYTTIAGTSLKIASVDANGEWIDFVFDDVVVLTGGASYWVVLASDTPDDGVASNLSASIYYDWHYDAASASGNDVADGNSFLMFSDDAGGTWSTHVDKMPACRYIEYLKVAYTPVMAVAEAENVTNLPDTTAAAANLSVSDPSVAHAKVALCDLYSAAADPASGGTTANFGTAATDSNMTDVREIVGYDGLEDDDQMSVIFPAMNTTENEIISISNEDSTSPVASDFSSICTGLASHISSTASGYTFKSYWKASEAYLARTFRKIWEFNQSEELSVRFGRFLPDAGAPTAFSTPLDASWSPDLTYNADLSTGVSLEAYLPDGEGAITTDTDMYVYGITITYTTLSGRVAASGGYLSVDDPTIFAANDYVWVEEWGTTGSSDLLKVSAVNGNILTLTAEAGFVPATTLFAHEVGDRVWLVERISVSITTTTGTEAASITITSADSNTFAGVAYVQPQSGATNPGTSGDIIDIRSV